MTAQQEGTAPCLAKYLCVPEDSYIKQKRPIRTTYIWLCFAHALLAFVCLFVCFFLFSIDNFCSCRLDEELREASEAAK